MIGDRRPTETYLADEGIEIRAANRIDERFGDKAHVNVTSYNRAVLLTGEVPDAAAKAEVEKIAAGVPNVKAISNELEIAGVSSLSRAQQRQLHHLQGQGALRRRQQVLGQPRQGGDRKRRRLPARHRHRARPTPRSRSPAPPAA